MNTVRHCYSLADFSAEEVRDLLSCAERLRGRTALAALRGRTILNLFLASSLRTRVSMDVAAQQLGAHAVTLQSDSLWDLEFAEGARMDGHTAEHAREAVRVLARYADLLAVRAFPRRTSWAADSADPVLAAFQAYATVPVINLESALYHPCQALADLLTIHNLAGDRPGKIVLAWTDHPRCLPVAVPNSLTLAVAQMGWDLTIVRPTGYDLPPAIMNTARGLADAAGGRIGVTDDRVKGFDGAAFVYAKSWGRIDRYGDEAHELAERRERGLAEWIVDRAIMRRTADARFMHCLPVRRNVVVTDDVIDGPRSVVVDQAENRLHAQKALLLKLLAAAEDAD